MKAERLLRECISSNLIIERQTDILYVKVCNYVFDLITSKGGDYQIRVHPNASKLKFKVLQGPEETRQEPIVTITDLFRRDDKKAFEDYTAATGDFYSFYEGLKKLQINFIYGATASGAAATMANDGVMRIYCPKDSGFDALIENQDYALAQDLVQKILAKDKTLFVHELTHYLNSIRSHYNPYRSKGGNKQFRIGNREYEESTEELQAHIISYYSLIRDELKRGGPGTSKLAYALARDNFNSFLKEYLKLSLHWWFDQSLDASDQKPGGLGDEKGIISQQGKRIIKRIYEIFEQLKEEGLDKVAPHATAQKVAAHFDNQIERLSSQFANGLQKNKLSSMVPIVNTLMRAAGIAQKSEFRTGVTGL